MFTENVFAQERQVGDLDLVEEVTNLLARAGHPRPENWKGDSHVLEAMGAAPKLQRFLINRYWRVQLGMCEESTTRERYCLVDTGLDSVYLQIFREAVVPTIIKLKIAF